MCSDSRRIVLSLASLRVSSACDINTPRDFSVQANPSSAIQAYSQRYFATTTATKPRARDTVAKKRTRKTKKKATRAKPKKKATKAKSRSRAKPKKKAKAKAGTRGRPRRKVKKELSPEEKKRSLVQELKKTALKRPAGLPSTAFVVVSSELGKTNKAISGKEAGEKYRNLAPEDLEV